MSPVVVSTSVQVPACRKYTTSPTVDDSTLVGLLPDLPAMKSLDLVCVPGHQRAW